MGRLVVLDAEVYELLVKIRHVLEPLSLKTREQLGLLGKSVRLPFAAIMKSILDKVCVLVAAAFALTLVPGFRRSESSLLSVRDRGTALVVFILLGLAEQVAVGRSSWYDHRIVAACSAGLLAGPGIGVVVAAFVTWLAVAYDGRPLAICGLAMLSGALAGGWLYRWRPRLAQHPLTGFCLTATISCLRDSLIFLCTPGMGPTVQIFTQLGIALVLQGLGTTLILAVVALIRDRDQQTVAAASAEVRALQSRMNPHFLCNALNTFATLATIAPHEIPRAAGRLRHFAEAITMSYHRYHSLDTKIVRIFNTYGPRMRLKDGRSFRRLLVKRSTRSQLPFSATDPKPVVFVTFQI